MSKSQSKIASQVYDLAIVGAGFSGLMAAYYAKKKGLNFIVLEQSNRVGGVLGSEQINGHLIEKSANTFVNSQEMQLLIEDLQLTDEQQFSICNHRYIYWQNNLEKLPQTPQAFLRSRLFSITQKLRMVAELCKGKSPQKQQTIEQFFSHRFGSWFSQILVDSFVSGIWAGDISQLSMDACFPNIKKIAVEKGSLIKHLVKKNKTIDSVNQPFVFKQGSNQLLKALEKEIKNNLLLKQKVQSVKYQKQTGFFIKTNKQLLHSKHLILSVPSYQCPDLLGEILIPKEHNKFQKYCQSITYAPLNLVYTAIKKSELTLKSGFGFLVPRIEANKNQLTLLGTLFSSQFVNRNFEDCHLLTSFIGGSHHPTIQEYDKTQCVELVKKDLTKIFKTKINTVWSDVQIWQSAVPQYDLKHQETIKQLQKKIEHLPIELHGNWLDGVSLSHLLKRSKAIIDNRI